MKKHLINISRIFLGLIFLIFGLNGFYTFIPVPEFHPFMEILVSTGFIYFVKTIEVICGTLLLLDRYKLLASLLLGPIVTNIILYHAFIDPRNWAICVVLVLLFSVLIAEQWQYFKVFLKNKLE